ncbi:hypothetical protein GCM10017596_12260 [Microbacterium keratanolyticum]|uniref:Antitoxin protein of toxin-antitoxin system n=2 Tax=Microbacterium keratanolyticum TaxID=67574 RepID=A0A9W6HRD6_9MICO|nr:hypothetical protein GCM10017596_12260 [Microbacterium keratanolyticum]
MAAARSRRSSIRLTRTAPGEVILPGGGSFVQNGGRPRPLAHTQTKGDSMGIGDSVNDAINKGKDFLEQNKDNIEGALKSEQAEGISDKVLDGLSDLAKKIAPDAADKIDEVRDNVDKNIGNE